MQEHHLVSSNMICSLYLTISLSHSHSLSEEEHFKLLHEDYAIIKYPRHHWWSIPSEKIFRLDRDNLVRLLIAISFHVSPHSSTSPLCVLFIMFLSSTFNFLKCFCGLILCFFIFLPLTVNYVEKK